MHRYSPKDIERSDKKSGEKTRTRGDMDSEDS